MPTITIKGKVHTPGSNTLKKMKRKAAMEAAAKAGKSGTDKPKSKKTKMEAPTPRPRSERPKKKPVEGLRVPKGPTVTKLKGKVGKKQKDSGTSSNVEKQTKKKKWVNKGNQMVKVMRYE